MPRHEFRTIEAFVAFLDKLGQDESDLKTLSKNLEVTAIYGAGHQDGGANCARVLADIVRNSNIGIVYPPAEQGDKS